MTTIRKYGRFMCHLVLVNDEIWGSICEEGRCAGVYVCVYQQFHFMLLWIFCRTIICRFSAQKYKHRYLHNGY